MGRMKELWQFTQELGGLESEDFETVILGMLNEQTKFTHIRKSVELDPVFDIVAEEFINDEQTIPVAFTLKRSVLITADFIQNIGTYRRQKGRQFQKLYLVTDADISKEAKEAAALFDITCWDAYKLFDLIPNINRYFDFEEKPAGAPKVVIREDNLTTALRKLSAGSEEWSTYQQLAGDIFTHVCCPPLGPPRYEHSDAEGRNRRDLIYENANDHLFWRSLRDIYHAHYIVVDAKNSANELDKRPIIDIAHYLKPYGCGMFGIILSRVGAGDAGMHAIREQWIGNQKMIVVLNDTDLLQMLDLKKRNSAPEEVIRVKIADFRMRL